METIQKIMVCFLRNKTPMTIREISKNIHADYRITHTAVQRLLTKKILLAQTVGSSSLCRLNPAYYGVEIYLAENKRKEEILKNSTIKQLYKELLAKIDTSLFILLLFGSYALGAQTKNSDIDLMFITNDQTFEEKVSTILSLLPLKTHALVFTEEEFIRMKDAKKPTVIQEAIEKNIILYGIENFYHLKHA